MSILKYLSIALVLQIALTLYLHLQDNELDAFQGSKIFIKFEKSAIDKLILEEKDKLPLVLAKKNNTWVFPDSSDFPASAQKVKNLLNKLHAIKRPYPVGKTPVAAKQFNVADDRYEKKITLFKGKQELKPIFISNSLTFKKVYMRIADEVPVYEVEFDMYQASSSHWWDRTYLHFNRKNIEELRLSNFTLKQTSENVFELDNLLENQMTNSKKVDEILQRVSNLNFSEMLGIDTEKKFQEYINVFTYSVVQKSAKVVDYEFLTEKENINNYVLKVSDKPYYFKLNENSVQNIKNAKREDFVKEKTKAKEF